MENEVGDTQPSEIETRTAWIENTILDLISFSEMNNLPVTSEALNLALAKAIPELRSLK